MGDSSDINDLLRSLEIGGRDSNGAGMAELARKLKSQLRVDLPEDGYVELANSLAKMSMKSKKAPGEGDESLIIDASQNGASRNNLKPRGRSPARSGVPGNSQSSSLPPSRSSDRHTPSPVRQNYNSRGPHPFGVRNPSSKYMKSDQGKKAASPEEKKEQENPLLHRMRAASVRSNSPHREAADGIDCWSSPANAASSSRPTTPVNQIHSRSSSPYSARPGLQEDGNEETASLTGKSPVRPFTSGLSIAGSAPGIPMSISGMSSQHPSGVPTSRHHRSRSAGVDSDAESISKPDKPRTHSRSPMRRPASTDEDGDRPIAPPRSFSKSPQDRGTSYVNLRDASNEHIQMPDLSMPDFGSGQSSLDGDRMFTPPPRAASVPMTADSEFSAMSTSNLMDSTPFSVTDEKDTSSTLKPRPMFSDVGDSGFQIDLNNGRRPKARRPKPTRHVHPPKLERMCSPMEVDGTPDQKHPPTVAEKYLFNVGSVDPKPFRPRKASQIANSADARATLAPKDVKKPQLDNGREIQQLLYDINAKREEAKSYYISGDYQSSIQTYSKAIQSYYEGASILRSDILALLLSNRAACLLMVGAYDSAASNCRFAIDHVSESNPKDPFTNDSGLLLRIKLHTRLGRAYLKLGDHVNADATFSEALRLCERASRTCKEHQPAEFYEQNHATVVQLNNEASMGINDSHRLKSACDGLVACEHRVIASPDDRGKLAEALGQANIALSIASGSTSLTEAKALIMVKMKRWREVAGFCERLAAVNVILDGVYAYDLASQNPFPGVSPAQFLKADFFQSLRDEDSSTRELKLNSRSSAEAVLRLSYGLRNLYVRALRLEERYPAADAALKSLDDLARRCSGMEGFPADRFSWVVSEKAKLDRTKAGREEGDEYFRKQDYEKAAEKYEECLCIDGDDMSKSGNAGGRLHAVLHCNRAACLMALRRFHGAVDECTSALKIHTRYMKAILRRARCYSRMGRKLEAICEYQRWIDLVDESKQSDTLPSSPCLFDGPRDVKPNEVTSVRSELDELRKAKRRADAKAQEEMNRRRANAQRDFFQENFSESWRSTSGASTSGASYSAKERRDEWRNQQNSGPRRWDSFNNRGPRSTSNPRPRFSERQEGRRSNSQGRPRTDPLVSPRSNTGDHYSVLEIPRAASTEDIKKAYKKLALKYHPDKNQDDGAAESFRRVTMARDVLSDPLKRRQYDSEQGFRRHF